MSEHYTAPQFTGLSCDKPSCKAERRCDPTPRWSSRLERFMRTAQEEGWTVWVGRSRRVYCPEHEPQPGHKMRQVSTP